MKEELRESGTHSHNVDGPGDLADAVIDTMVRVPMRVTGDLMVKGVQGIQRLAGVEPEETTRSTGHSEVSAAGPADGQTAASNSSLSSLTRDQDLSGPDLKYVAWSLVFTKPGHECVLQPRQDELLNYSADANSYAALKIAQYLNATRTGHSMKPQSWAESGYPHAATTPRLNDGRSVDDPQSLPASHESAFERQRRQEPDSPHAAGWQIPAEDQKFIVFMYNVERRLPRQEEVTRTERVVIQKESRIG